MATGDHNKTLTLEGELESVFLLICIGSSCSQQIPTPINEVRARMLVAFMVKLDLPFCGDLRGPDSICLACMPVNIPESLPGPGPPVPIGQTNFPLASLLGPCLVLSGYSSSQYM